MQNQVKWCCFAVSLFATSGVAQPLYKSVNEQGEVTFSDTPQPHAVDVQEIQVQPGPSAAQQQESIERAKRIESQASDLGTANAERAQQRKDAQLQSQQQAKDEVQPLPDYNDGYSYPRRPLYPPVISPPIQPERPILPERPVRPVQLPAAPVVAPRR